MESIPVLVLLAVIWAAVLVPPWVQSRRAGRPTDTIRSFHEQLSLLGRTTPDHAATRFVTDDRRVRSTVWSNRRARFVDEPRAEGEPDLSVPADVYGEAAYDEDAYLDADAAFYGDAASERDAEPGAGRGPAYAALSYSAAGDGHGDLGTPGDDPRLSNADAGYPGLRVAHRPLLAGEDPRSGSDRWAERAPRPVRRASPPEAARSQALAYRRRRRVVAVLVASVAITLSWALVLGATGLWITHALADALLVTYLALLVRRQRRTSERLRKVHYLAPIEAPRPAVVVLRSGAAR
ncbi:MAG TPA: hypothetical protein VK306_09520 [Acidimicrobiales bacterium]|nr:hypothetical protein [Acidimicrobiales bacterium]